MLTALGGVGTVAVGLGAVRADPPPFSSHDECVPGHDEDDSACQAFIDDIDVLVPFDATDTDVPLSFRYPCGWRTTVRTDEFDDRLQVNVGVYDLVGEGVQVDVQLRFHHESVAADYLDGVREDGQWEDVEEMPPVAEGIVTAVETADLGTTGKAVVPHPAGDAADAWMHVEIVSTVHGISSDSCPRHQLDYRLVKEMLRSLRPPGAAYLAKSSKVVRGTRGTVVPIPFELENTDSFAIEIGSDDLGYLVTIAATDDGDGEVTIEWDTARANHDPETDAWSASGGEVTAVTRVTGGFDASDRRIAAEAYPVSVRVDGWETDLGTISLRDATSTPTQGPTPTSDDPASTPTPTPTPGGDDDAIPGPGIVGGIGSLVGTGYVLKWWKNNRGNREE